MTAKPSLYELLGLTDKASAEEISAAYENCRRALEAEADSEEKHNRAAVLTHAYDILHDRRLRAGYDRRQRDRRQALLTSEPERRRLLLSTVGLGLVLAAAYPAWSYLAPVARAVLAEEVTHEAVANPAGGKPGRYSVAEEIASMQTAAPPAEPLPAASPKIPAEPQTELKRPRFNVSYAATLDKFADSTYLIIGGIGHGTGVAIESDKLLTNCHVIAPNVLKGPILAISPTTRQKTRITAAAFLITEDACVVHAPGLNGKPITMGNAMRLSKGAPIFNVGFAKGELTTSSGALLGVIDRGGQAYLVSSNYCDEGVSGGPLVDVEGRLVGLTSGGPPDRSFCLSLTAETARRVLSQTMIAIDAFPTNYLSNLVRRW